MLGLFTGPSCHGEMGGSDLQTMLHRHGLGISNPCADKMFEALSNLAKLGVVELPIGFTRGQKCLVLAHSHDFPGVQADNNIRSFPESYNTLVGQGGIRLSGGQRQRIAIARAILRDPTILIFDEAMSQIDTESEFKIAMALKEFMKNRTSFVIAHRFSTIVSADIIICLDAGKIVGMGKHQALLSACETYRQLYNTQFREVG